MGTKASEVLTALMARCGQHVDACIRRRFADDQDLVDDVKQEVWCRIWEELRRHRTIRKPDAWLMGICRHVCADTIRKLLADRRQRTAAASIAETETSTTHPDDSVPGMEMADSIANQLAALPARPRAVAIAHFLLGQPHSEIAAKLNISTGAARKALHTAVERLRRSTVTSAWSSEGV
jgi:RNA polymerase sigma-70 factor (ECF subfamily)